jgi:aspartate kinase
MRILEFQSSDIQDEGHLSQAVESVVKEIDQKPIVFVAAMGRTTERLLEAGKKSAEQDLVLASAVAEGLRTYHMQIAQQLTADSVWKETRALLSDLFEELSELLKGIYLLGDFSPYSESVVTSYGERASVVMVSQALKQKGLEVMAFASREVFAAAGGSITRLSDRARAADLEEQVLKATEQGNLPVLPACLRTAILLE